MDALEAIARRASVRSYLAAPPPEKIEEVLKAGFAAPTACGARPWSFCVSGPKKAAELGYDAPCVITVCAEKREPSGPKAGYELEGLWQQDCAAAVENMLVAAVALGLGACWRVCWPSPALAGKAKAVLGLPFGVVPFAHVTIGVPAENPEPKNNYDPSRVRYLWAKPEGAE